MFHTVSNPAIVSIPKPKDYYSKPLKCDDFRGTAISPILSKVFEYCLLDKFNHFQKTSDTQFGFEKGLGCNHAIFSVRTTVESFVRKFVRKPLCHWLSKAFWRSKSSRPFYQANEKKCTSSITRSVGKNMLFHCYSCVKWENSHSDFFTVMFCVRQGSVLAPFLFAVFLDELSDTCNQDRNRFIVVYADDILLISTSVVNLENLIHLCERELNWLDMAINYKKSC